MLLLDYMIALSLATPLPAGKNKDLSILVNEVSYVLDYSRKLAKYADEEDLMPGLGHVSLAGGVLAQEGKASEVRDGGSCCCTFRQVTIFRQRDLND